MSDILYKKFSSGDLVMTVDSVSSKDDCIYLEIDYQYNGGECGEFLVFIPLNSPLDSFIEKKEYDFNEDEDGEQIGYVPDFITIREALLISDVILVLNGYKL